MSNIQKLKFLDVFDEDSNEVLKLKVNLQVKGDNFNEGETFRKGEKMAGVDFHILRYFDLAVELLEDDRYKLTGFFSKK